MYKPLLSNFVKQDLSRSFFPEDLYNQRHESNEHSHNQYYVHS